MERTEGRVRGPGGAETLLEDEALHPCAKLKNSARTLRLGVGMPPAALGTAVP